MRTALALALVLSVFAPLAGESTAARSPGPVAPPQPGSRVLVMPFTTTADPDAAGGASAALWLGEAAAILLAERLEASGVGVFSRDDRVALFDRLRLPLAAALTRATMIRMGELAGASEIVFGRVRLGSLADVSVETIRISEGRELAAVSDRAGVPELLALGARLGDRVAAVIGPTPASRPAPRPAVPFAAFENYVKGLVATMPAAAQRFLESAMTLAPHDGRILTALWSVYTGQDLHEKALAAASAVPADAAESGVARLNAALSLIELRRYDGAERALVALGAERPSAAVWNALGIVALRRQRATAGESASAHFARAAAAQPSVTDYHFNLGYARARLHDPPGAILALREAIRRNTADADAHLVLSTLLASTGKAAEAAHEFELASLLGPSLDPVPAAVPSAVPVNLERVTSDLDRPIFTAQDAAFERVLPRAGAPAAPYLSRGLSLATARQDLEASSELRRAIYLAPYEDQAHLALGRLYQRSGRLADAIDEFKVAIWCRDTAAARVALGTAFLESGDRDAARREADRALVLTPNSAEARALLRRIDGGLSPTGVLPSTYST